MKKLKLLRKITTTNISDVWEAELNGIRVVVKKPVNREMVKILRFIKEAKYWKNVSDLNINGIAKVVAIDEEEPWFAVEFVEGNILTDALEHASFRDIAQRMLEVLKILDVVHSQGYLHLDIKPSNIMIDKYGDTVLLDWGLAAKVFRKLKDDEYRFIGTPYYAPPELRNPEKYGTPDARSDIYEVAATFYRIITKQVPFASEDDMENGILRPFPSTVPEELQRIIKKAMSPRKEMRYNNAREMYAQIKNWLKSEKVLLEGVHTTTFREKLELVKNHGLRFLPDPKKVNRNAVAIINGTRFDMNNGIYLDFGFEKKFRTKKLYHGAYLYYGGKRLGQVDLGDRNLVIADFPWKNTDVAKKFFELVKLLRDYGANLIFKVGKECFNIAAARVLLKSQAPGCEIEILWKAGVRRVHLRLREERGIDADYIPKTGASAKKIFFDLLGCDV